MKVAQHELKLLLALACGEGEAIDERCDCVLHQRLLAAYRRVR